MFLSSSSFAETNVRFTPSKYCKNAVVHNNDKAEKSVDAAFYSINNRKTVAAYQKRFEELWKLNTKTKSDRWFKQKNRNK